MSFIAETGRAVLAAVRAWWAGLARADVIAGCAAFVVGAVFSWWASSQVPARLYGTEAWDVWFEADLPRIKAIMTMRNPPEVRATHHPLFSTFTFPATKLLMVLGAGALLAIRCMMAAMIGLWMALLYSILRAVGTARPDAVLFSVAGLASAGLLFFSCVPETFLVGSLTMMVAVWWVARDEEGRSSPLAEALVSAATVAPTLTNWMFGILATFHRRRFRQFLQITANALVILIIVWTFQRYWSPRTEFFLGVRYHVTDGAAIFSPESHGTLSVLSGFFAHPAVMPEMRVAIRPGAGAWPILLTQGSGIGSAGGVGMLAVSAWFALLAIGTTTLLRLREKPRMRRFIWTAVLGQLALHIVFGNETFLYSLHWIPLLVVVAAFATRGRAAMAARAIAVVFIATAAINNFTQFDRALAFVESEADINSARLAERDARPGDPWPGEHTGLRADGFDFMDISALDQGGGLWPGMSAFHLGPWVVSDAGERIAASMDLPPVGVTVDGRDDGAVIERRVVTPHYTVTWLTETRRSWQLELDVPGREGENVYLVLRGVGYAHARVYSLERDGADVLINDRWRLLSTGSAPRAAIGVEAGAEWFDALDDGAESVASVSGWGALRIGPLAPGTHAFQIRDDEVHLDQDIDLGVIPGSYSVGSD